MTAKSEAKTEFVCEVPSSLGRVTKLRIKGGKVIAETESGTQMIVPIRRVQDFNS